MNKYVISVLVGMLLSTPSLASASVNIFACEPEWAALAEEVGGEHVEVFSATSAKQDPHHIRVRPSLIAAIRKADILICSGAGLEEGWLPILLQRAGASLQHGGVGSLMASDYVEMIEKPLTLDRSLGHLHASGNPHVHLNPHNIQKIANELTKRLQAIDGENKPDYVKLHADFTSNWQKAIAEWEEAAVSLKGTELVVHHKAFTYLLDWLGLKTAATLERVPGIPPTTSHLEALMQQLKAKPAAAIVRTPYDMEEASLWLSEKTNTPALVLPYTVGGDEESQTLYQLIDRSIALLKEAKHAN